MNPEECRKHPLNNSHSKLAYRFGTSQRFNTPKLHTHSMYTIDSKPEKKGSTFGHSKRPSLEIRTSSPSPQTYTLPSTIKQSLKRFGSGREEHQFGSFLLKALKEKNRPAPNAYMMPSSINDRRKSMGARLPTELDLLSKNDVPAPTRYDLEYALMNPEGKYASSKNKNARRIVFFGRDIPKQASLQVGPGQYNIGSKSVDSSKFRQTYSGFGTAQRPSPADRSKKHVPGPGMYSTFSEFPDWE